MTIPAFVVARSGSTRLKEKLLEPLGSTTALAHLLSSVSTSRLATPVLCTTWRQDDDRLVALADAQRMGVFRGDPDDVPTRLLAAARQRSADFFVLVESDEVFTDGVAVDQIVESYRATGAECIRMTGVPLGYWVMGLRVETLERVCALRPVGEPGWGRFLQPPAFQVAHCSPQPPLSAHHLDVRMTLDYPEDLALLRAIFDRLLAAGRPVTLREALRLLDEEPSLNDINRHCVEKYGLNPGLPLTGAAN